MTESISASTLARLAGDLRVRGVRALRGRNLWSPDPVVAGEVVLGGLADSSPADAEGFAQRLAEALPGSARLGDAASWPGAVLHVAMELQRRAGSPVSSGRIVEQGADDPPVLVMGYDEAELGTEAVHEAAALVRACLRGDDPETERVVAALHAIYLKAHPGPTATVLIAEARRRGIPVRRAPGEHVVQLGLGRSLRRTDATMTDRTSVIATDLTSDKDRTKRLLDRYLIPVPRGGVAHTLDEALDIAADLRYPVLIKPLDANDGRGISGALHTDDDLRAAWPVALAEHPTVVVERYVEGRDHRVVVVDGRVVAVAERVAAHVTGDGRRSIRALAEEENRNPARDMSRPERRRALTPLPLDALTERHLARSGWTLDSVPAAGETVCLRATANISTGGTSIDRTDDIHPRNASLCELATAAVGLDIAGLDVLTHDISVPFDENGAAIIEVNASPGIRMHTDPDEGTPRDVPGAVLDMLYPPGSETTIPVIAVTGTNGKTTTTRLIAHLLRQTGKRVGFTTTDGVYHQEQLLMEGDLTGPLAADIVLSDPRVEVAVLETARGGILRSGLGYGVCDVGVVMNVSPDHLGMRGIHTVEQLAEVKALIPASVKPGGHTVLNADDPLVLRMRAVTEGELVLFSFDAGHPAVAEHLAAGGTALVVEDEGGRETIVIRRGGERIPVAAAAEVPLTLGGAAKFQVQNAMAAVAAVYTQGVSVDEIRAGLMTFLPSGATTPGRMNVLRTARGRVVVDYAHNPAAVRALAEFARRSGARRCIGLVTMPGDRRDQDLRDLGLAASGLDYVIAKEHPKYLRGRAPGDVARLISEGLEAGGLPSDRWETVLSEPEAVDKAMEMMQEGDIILIVADDTAAVLEQLQPHVVEE
ncbi:cyanophycin synthetase [Longimicrobium sp.]|uniref:cyanophycin synthetase n=1 Tax=Longimicrobium sp. TaxID=2029185 RepID=UPI003B3BDD70